jgi:hypothetical protein
VRGVCEIFAENARTLVIVAQMTSAPRPKNLTQIEDEDENDDDYDAPSGQHRHRQVRRRQPEQGGNAGLSRHAREETSPAPPEGKDTSFHGGWWVEG